MKTEWHQQDRSGDFIVTFKEKYTFFTILRLVNWIPDRRLLSDIWPM